MINIIIIIIHNLSSSMQFILLESIYIVVLLLLKTNIMSIATNFSYIIIIMSINLIRNLGLMILFINHNHIFVIIFFFDK